MKINWNLIINGIPLISKLLTLILDREDRESSGEDKHIDVVNAIREVLKDHDINYKGIEVDDMVEDLVEVLNKHGVFKKGE